MKKQQNILHIIVYEVAHTFTGRFVYCRGEGQQVVLTATLISNLYFPAAW